MTRSHGLIGAAFLVVALTVATVSHAAPTTRDHAAPAAARSVPTPVALTTVRNHVETWLHTNGFAGFKVAEVMAFTTNDYVAVNDKAGKPAFELLVGPNRSWIMEEPASMMWNTKYGMLPPTSGTIQPIPGMSMMWGGGMMMGSPHSWYYGGDGAVTSVSRAAEVANSWLAENRQGERAESDGRAFPGYFTLDTTRNGKTFGMLSVNRTSGAIWYHGWHGTFFAEKQIRVMTPQPGNRVGHG